MSKVLQSIVLLDTLRIEWDGINRLAAAISPLRPEDAIPELEGLTSLVLAQFCAGFDVNAPAYLEALQTALDAVENHIEDEDED